MLTGDLLRVQVKNGQLRPRFVDPSRSELQERAQQVIALFELALAEGWTRGELTEALRELEGVDPDHKLLRGLGKVMLDRSELETVADLDPVAVRAAVFSTAAAMGPLRMGPAGPGRAVAADVYAAVAQARGEDPEALRLSLYADLKDAQRVVGCRALSPEALLHRYNVALVQALLLRARYLKVRLVQPRPKRLEQLLRFARFHELMVRVEALPGQVAVLVHLDGPESLLRQSTRYGLQLATFFPAVLLQEGEWSVEAEVLWGQGRKTARSLLIAWDQGLRSHYADTGVWRSRTELWFEERWGGGQDGWTMRPGELQVVEGQDLLVPVWTFEKGGRRAHLDLVGYWRPAYLEKRIARTPPDVILAVSRRLCGDKQGLPEGLRDRVIDFAEVIPLGSVLEKLEAVAR